MVSSSKRSTICHRMDGLKTEKGGEKEIRHPDTSFLSLFLCFGLFCFSLVEGRGIRMLAQNSQDGRVRESHAEAGSCDLSTRLDPASLGALYKHNCLVFLFSGKGFTPFSFSLGMWTLGDIFCCCFEAFFVWLGFFVCLFLGNRDSFILLTNAFPGTGRPQLTKEQDETLREFPLWHNGNESD